MEVGGAERNKAERNGKKPANRRLLMQLRLAEQHCVRIPAN